MKPIALLGAGGYVGARLIERSELLGDLPLVPIVRQWRSQGRLARFGFRTVQGDAGDPSSLVPLLKGCGMVVNLTMGSDEHIVDHVQAIHAACIEAEVPLFVHMSSAEVFGRVEVAGLTEDTAPDGRHWMEYAREKAAAETWLRSQSNGPVNIVVLRPGLIWGPGSGWLVQPAQQLIDGNAYLFRGGRGICNLIHVDNLIAHLVQLAKADRADSGVFNIADPETLSWADYYRAIAFEVGVEESSVQIMSEGDFREARIEKILTLANSAPARAVKGRMSGATKVRIKQQLQDWISPPITEPQVMDVRVSVTKQLWWIQGTARKLPSTAFVENYPDLKLRPFAELMSAAGEWLRYAGFQRASGYSGDIRQ